MRRLFATAAVLWTGCTFGTQTGEPEPISNEECVLGRADLFVPCEIGIAQPQPVHLADSRFVYDTDSGVLRDLRIMPPGDPAVTHSSTLLKDDQGTPIARMIVSESFTVSGDARLRARGSLPLVVVSFDQIDISGRFDVSSRFNEIGAGGNAAPSDPSTEPCALAGGAGDNGGGGQTDGSGGGAGGTGSGQGGAGGTGRDGGVAGGTAPAPTGVPDSLVGGCPGGHGGIGNGSDAADRGHGGPGGGALYLAARTTLSIAGDVHASGSGGDEAESSRSGGGGGGAGGLIGLSAGTIELAASARLAANGGGGAGGTDMANDALDGADGSLSSTPAAGGDGHMGGDGGDGGVDSVDAQPGGNGGRGGGGGGGGGGWIVNYAGDLNDDGALVSPAVTSAN